MGALACRKVNKLSWIVRQSIGRYFELYSPAKTVTGRCQVSRCLANLNNPVGKLLEANAVLAKQLVSN